MFHKDRIKKKIFMIYLVASCNSDIANVNQKLFQYRLPVVLTVSQCNDVASINKQKILKEKFKWRIHVVKNDHTNEK